MLFNSDLLKISWWTHQKINLPLRSYLKPQTSYPSEFHKFLDTENKDIQRNSIIYRNRLKGNIKASKHDFYGIKNVGYGETNDKRKGIFFPV